MTRSSGAVQLPGPEDPGRIRLDKDGQVSIITISCPQRHNALNVEMWGQFRDAVREVATDRAVRAVIVRGEGDVAFSAGADISEFGTVRNSPTNAQHYVELIEESELALINVRKPTIALLRGICAGGGSGIALACAIRFADETFRFSIPASKLGVIYHQTAIDRLVQQVGPSVALDLLMSATEIDADEARMCGLVNRLFSKEELDEATLAYAQKASSRAPLSVEGAWVGVQLAQQPRYGDFARELARLQHEAIESEDYREGVDAFMTKRRPTFKGR